MEITVLRRTRKSRTVSMLPAVILGVWAFSLFTGCATEGPSPPEAEVRRAETESMPGGWTVQKAQEPEVRAAFAFFRGWYNEQGPFAGWCPQAVVRAATQVVSGLNLKLEMEGDGGAAVALLYRDLSGAYTVVSLTVKDREVYSE